MILVPGRHLTSIHGSKSEGTGFFGDFPRHFMQFLLKQEIFLTVWFLVPPMAGTNGPEPQVAPSHLTSEAAGLAS
jgi:hypothetical protein